MPEEAQRRSFDGELSRYSGLLGELTETAMISDRLADRIEGPKPAGDVKGTDAAEPTAALDRLADNNLRLEKLIVSLTTTNERVGQALG